MSEQSDLPQIDESQPGSSPDENDGVSEQLDAGDTLLDRGLVDPLDEGWSPPDREPSVDVPTEREEEEGESLDRKLAAEVPDVGVGETEWTDEVGGDVGDERSGRLLDPEGDTGGLVGQDLGIDGAGASAEEAAVHIIDVT